MHAVQLSSGSPAALADWNNLHNDDPDLVNLWHCGVFPRGFSRSRPHVRVHGVVAANDPEAADRFHGVVELIVDPSAVTLARVTQDPEGAWKALVVEGRIEANPAATYGSYGWCRIPSLRSLYRDVLLRHFPHHVALTRGLTGGVLREAFGSYLGLELYPPGDRGP
jgi:L-fucose isomerase-like protein